MPPIQPGDPVCRGKSITINGFAQSDFKERINDVTRYEYLITNALKSCSNQDIESTSRYCSLERKSKAEQRNIFVGASDVRLGTFHKLGERY